MANYTSKSIINKLTGIAEASIETNWLDFADSEIENDTGVLYFPAETETLKIDGPGGGTLVLPKFPIIEITKIVCDTVEIKPIASSFAIYNDEGIIKVLEGINYDYLGLDEVFAKGTQNIEVTGKFGTESTPKIVVELATLIVIRIMQENNLVSKDKVQESIGDYSVRYKENSGDISKTIDDLFELLPGHDDAYGEAV